MINLLKIFFFGGAIYLIACNNANQPGRLILDFKFTGSNNVQFSARVYDSSNVLQAALPSSSFFNPEKQNQATTTSTDDDIVLLEVSGSTISATEKTLNGGVYTLYVMIDDDQDGALLAENNWLSGNKGIKKTVSINGDTTEILESADFTSTSSVTVTMNTSVSSTLEFKRGFCQFILDDILETADSAYQFGKSEMSKNYISAVGSGTTDRNFKLINGIYNIYCLIDLNENGTLDSGEYDAFIENFTASGTALTVDSFTKR